MKLKILESTFDEYVNINKNLHQYNNKYLKLLDNINNNLIFYGPKGIGKYTQSLLHIKQFSPTDLKYERKINIINHKKEYIFKISDIHFEIDMELLGCNAKLLWNDIYYQIIDIVSSRENKTGIILCKNFHKIHSELLDIFYSYMQTLYHMNINLNYIFLTEHISFIPDNIMNKCIVLPFKRPTKTAYNKCIKYKIPKNFDINELDNIKMFKVPNIKINNILKNISDKIIHDILHYKNIAFLNFRDNIYNIFIYQLKIIDSVWYILDYFIQHKHLNEEKINIILPKIYTFLKLFNNNYRPIYHVENLLFFICKQIHNF
jgi:hypothetical protein